jgi:hypothetical protein
MRPPLFTESLRLLIDGLKSCERETAAIDKGNEEVTLGMVSHSSFEMIRRSGSSLVIDEVTPLLGEC